MHSFSPSQPLSAESTVEISIQGKWTRVPALTVGGNTVAITGRWLKIASIAGEDSLETDLSNPDLCIRELKDRADRRRIDIFTFAQQPPATQPKYRYPVEWESIAVASTNNFQQWWESLPHETRRNVRRAHKRGVVVSVKQFDDDLIRGIVGVNNDSPVRQNKAFVHYGKTFDQVKFDQSPFIDRSDFICAYLGEEMIGFVKLLYRGSIASIVQFLPKPSHQDKRPGNALLAKAVELCATKGVSYLTYGLFRYGNKGDNSLLDFKIRNGFTEILVPRFYVPLTPWGALCIRLKLYRRLLDILPRSALVIALRARAQWIHLSEMIHWRNPPSPPDKSTRGSF